MALEGPLLNAVTGPSVGMSDPRSLKFRDTLYFIFSL